MVPCAIKMASVLAWFVGRVAAGNIRAASAPFCVGGLAGEMLPKTHSDAVLDVYWLQAPVFSAMVGKIPGTLLGAHHSGVGFRDQTTGLNFTIEYDAVNEVLNSTVPLVVGGELVWQNKAHYCMNRGVNESYWSQARVPIGKMNGAQFNKLMDNFFVANNVSESVNHYQVWSVSRAKGEKAFIDPYTCVEGGQKVLKFLAQEAGVVFDKTAKTHGTIIHVFAEQPVPVNYTDPAVHADILKMYEASQVFHTQPVLHRIKNMLEFAIHMKYLYANGTYYKLSKLHFPFIEFINEPFDLPTAAVDKVLVV